MNGHLNIIFGWVWLSVGLLFGMTLGLKAEGETWLGGYASLTRRYLRLGHIAFIALSLINIVFGMEVASVVMSDSVKTIASILLVFGAAGVPLACLVAAFWRKAKFFLPLPASAVLAGSLIMFVGWLGT